MENTENTQKKSGNTGLIVILLLAVLGLAGYVCYDKLMEKKDSKITECEKELKALKAEKNTTTKEETTETENTTTTTNDSKYTEKVYSKENGVITLFKSGKCVVTSNYEYTAKCSYSLDNNTLTITRQNTGIGDGSEKTYTYSVITEGNEEYIQLGSDKNERFKLLK